MYCLVFACAPRMEYINASIESFIYWNVYFEVFYTVWKKYILWFFNKFSYIGTTSVIYRVISLPRKHFFDFSFSVIVDYFPFLYISSAENSADICNIFSFPSNLLSIILIVKYTWKHIKVVIIGCISSSGVRCCIDIPLQ